ncbi:MAG: hypothetical protein KDD32_00530 [Bacteroidetes bacterium]|nr:hypothetical protein [Bacteroidota bacterium]
MSNLDKILNNKWLIALTYFIVGAVTLLSIYVFIAGGDFIAILDTLY